MTTQPHEPQTGRESQSGLSVDWSWTASDEDWIPPEIDISKPSAARMYDFALGGKDNFEVDRRAVNEIGRVIPDLTAVASANRGFLVRAVDLLAEQGIDQFVDLGAGIPTSPNVHEVAQVKAPGVRVAYIDNDPIVMAYNRALRAPRPGVLALDHDLRHPQSLLEDPRLRAHIDLGRPVGLLFIAVLHFVRREMAIKVVEQYRRLLPPGSCIAISAICSDGMEPGYVSTLEKVYDTSPTPLVVRSRSQVEQLFDGTELIGPGLVDVTHWRDDQPYLPIRVLCGVGRVV